MRTNYLIDMGFPFGVMKYLEAEAIVIYKI